VYETYALTAASIGAGAAVLGAGTSVFGGITSSSAQRAAAAANAQLSKQSAIAQGQVAKYQANLNYANSMAQASMDDNNAAALHTEARATEMQGDNELGRMALQNIAQDSAARAQYGASGIQTDAGSPLVVSAYNQGNAQMNRLDSLYKTNIAAYNEDWQGTTQKYQADLTRANATQFQYAAQMADWNTQMGIASAGVQQQQANNAANATLLNSFGSAFGQIGQAANGLGFAYARGGAGSGAIAVNKGEADD
jgi:hypothetical protein